MVNNIDEMNFPMNAEVIDVQGDERTHLSGVDRGYMAHVILGAYTARYASEGYVESGSVTVVRYRDSHVRFCIAMVVL